MSWEQIELGDFITLKRGYDLPERLRLLGEVPIVSSSGVSGSHNKAKVKGPGVVTGRYGTLGEVFYVEKDFWPLNTALYVQDFKGNNCQFVSYYLKNILNKVKSDKAAVPGVNRNDLHARKVVVTRNLKQQEQIVYILSTYDDLIENNRRRIQLMEESARLLYEEWFVRLRFPGHEHVKIVDGIPEGWEKKKIKELLAKIKRPPKIKKEDYVNDGPIPCVDQSREFIGGYTHNSKAIIHETPVIVFGDHTRVLKFIDFPFASGADGTQLLVSNNENISQEFLYFSLIAVDLSNYFYARHFKFLKEQEILIPQREYIQAFTNLIVAKMKKIKTLREYNRQLAQARDLLLPKLMTGEIAL